MTFTNHKYINKHTLTYIVFSVIFTGCVLFLFWKCRYGYGNLDESFYLTIPYRLCRGDGLLKHEWHVSQLSGFLMLPIMRIYLWIVPNTDGIVLHFRWIFTACWSVAALFYFYRLEQYSSIGAAIASLSFLIFAPRGIMALSYNSLGIMLLLSAAIIPITSKKHKQVEYIFAGLCFAGAVLSSPFIVLLYVILTVAVFYQYIKKRNKTIVRQWFCFSLGCFILFVLFSISVFCHCSPSDLIRVFPWILSDPDHPHKPLWRITAIYFYMILTSHPIAVYLLGAGALMILASIKWKRMKLPGFIGVCILSSIYLLAFQFTKRDPDYLMLPITLVGFYCSVTSKQKAIRTLFYGVWIPGALYSYFVCWSSNQWLYSISLALAVACVASIVIICMYIKELTDVILVHRQRLWPIAFASMLLIIQIGSELDLRYSFLYWEPSMDIQTEYIDKGPEKGLYVAENRKEEYEKVIDKLKKMKENDDISNVLLITRSAVAYLYVEKDSSAYSAWLGIIAAREGSNNVDAYNIDKMEAYFTINPDKIPDAIFIDNGEDINDEYASYCNLKGYIQSPDTQYYMKGLSSN